MMMIKMEVLCNQSIHKDKHKINTGVLNGLLFYAWDPYIFYSIWIFYVFYVNSTRFMISSETPHKLAEIIRDTWPQIYRPSKTNTPKLDNRKKT